MRFSTIASFLIAIILAGVAVFGVQRWLVTERARIETDAQAQLVQAETAPKSTLVVADKAISFGQRIEPNVLREIEWASDVLPEGSYSKIADVVVGPNPDQQRFALTSIAYGEPVLATKITVPGQRAKLSTQLDSDKKAVSIRVNDVLGVAGFVLPGDRVDVLITRGSGSNTFVDVLLQGVKVVAIDQVADDQRDAPSVVRTVTFEVNTPEAQKLVLGANVGTLSLALRNVGSNAIEASDRITVADLNEEDAADDLIAANMAQAEQDAISGEEEARILELEAQIASLTEGVNERLEGVVDMISEQQVQPAPTPVAQPAPSISRTTGVGVIRNGARKEYKVLRLDQIVDAIEDSQYSDGVLVIETEDGAPAPTQ